MKLQIERRENLVLIDGVPCRVWDGVTEGGAKCLVMVHRIAAPEGQDDSEFRDGLQEQSPPANVREQVASPQVRQWIEGEFRRQIRADELIDRHLHHVKVGMELGADINQIMRIFVASVVLDIADMPPNTSSN